MKSDYIGGELIPRPRYKSHFDGCGHLITLDYGKPIRAESLTGMYRFKIKKEKKKGWLAFLLITLLFISCSEDIVTPGCDCDVVTYDATGRVLDRQHSPGHCEPQIIYWGTNGKSFIECK